MPETRFMLFLEVDFKRKWQNVEIALDTYNPLKSLIDYSTPSVG